MSIISKIKLLFSTEKKLQEKPVGNEIKISMREREDKTYDRAQLSLQKLYEQWSCKESWHLYDEGIPLLFGIEPGTDVEIDDELSGKIESLWEHAQDCVRKKLLPVINSEKHEAEWEVRPIDLYYWGTVSRISMPDEFSTLMTFVAQTIKPAATDTGVEYNENSEDALYQKHREIVLGASTSLLVNASELCKNKKGKVVSKLIAQNIIENEHQWFGEDRPLLTEATMTDLIEEYLKLTRPMA